MDRLRPDGVVNVIGHFDLGPEWPGHVANVGRHLLGFDPLVILVGLHPEMTGSLSLLRDAVATLRSEVPVVIAVDAMLDALSDLGVRRVSVVTPGGVGHREHVAAVLEERDVDIVNHVGMERGLGNIGSTPLATCSATRSSTVARRRPGHRDRRTGY